MTLYLENGWFEPGSEQKLRGEVVDGAMDMAGSFIRANVSAQTLHSLALKVRSSITAVDPQMKGVEEFGTRVREIVLQRLQDQTEQVPELHAFVTDCLENIQKPTDLMGFYLHLVHISRMVQLLSQASVG